MRPVRWARFQTSEGALAFGQGASGSGRSNGKRKNIKMPSRRIEEDPAREHRIDMEVIVDAYDETERAMGWFYYLEDKLHFPFNAECVAKRLISPLVKKEQVRVEGMAPEEECSREVFVKINWQGRKLAVPLAQLKGIKVDSNTQEAIEDWHYWVERGYEF